MTYIDLFPCLTGDSYYRTDPHWRQDALEPVVQTLTSAMGAPLSWDFTAQDGGSSPGRTRANPVYPWSRTASCISPAAPSHRAEPGIWREISIYNWEKVQGRDPYEFFFSLGPLPFRFLENPAATSQRGLILFRDSFRSWLGLY